jgi:hypothetical protein
MNGFTLPADAREFLDELSSFSGALPAEVILWIEGLGNVTDPAGETWHLQMPTLPSSQSLNGFRGTFGLMSAQSVPAYATLPAPYLCARAVAECVWANQPGNAPGEWALDATVEPAAPAGHVWVKTRHMLGYRPSRLEPRHAIQVLRDLGWGARTAPPGLTGTFNVHVPSLQMVSQLLSTARGHEVVTFDASALKQTPLGSTVQLPFMCSGTQDPATPISTEMTLRSTFVLDQPAASTALACAYRIRRELDAARTSSPHFPWQLTTLAGAVVPLPTASNLNEWFDVPARLNQRVFETLPSDRCALLARTVFAMK